MPKGLLFISLLLLHLGVSAQFSDDFSDGDFTLDPTWSGDIAQFEILNGELHLNAENANEESHLSTPSEAINDAVWDFKVRMEVNPSNSNRMKVYLVSSAADVEGTLDGYYVLIGNNANEISLYKQSGTSADNTKIIDGTDDVIDADDFEVHVQVSRDGSGNWTLAHDVGLTGTFTTEGSVFDDTHITSAYFGVLCDYSTANLTAFYIDNIDVQGTGFVDNVVPSIVSSNVISENSIQLVFSESVDAATAEDTANFEWTQSGFASSATLQSDGLTVMLEFADDFPLNLEQILEVSGVTDLAGNNVNPISIPFTYFEVGEASAGDIIINEFMADPDDIGAVQEAEYVELFNTTEESFSLEGWALLDGTVERSLPSIVIPAQGYLIVCNEDLTSFLTNFGTVVGLQSFGITNGGEYIGLIDEQSTVIDEVDWDPTWYRGEDADGVSLERINPYLPCSNSSNWTASTSDVGGTPGSENAAIDLSPDETAPRISHVTLIDGNTIEVVFNEPLDELSIMTGSYFIENEAGTLVAVEMIDVTNASTVQVVASIEFVEGILYWISVEGLSDCSGNSVEDGSIGYFAIPQEAEAGDIVINEILFNERENGVDYVEIYNNSNRYIDLNGWIVSKRNFDGTEDDYEISDSYRLLRPGSFALLSSNSAVVKQEYPRGVEENFIQMPGFPSYTNSEGTVLLKNSIEEIQDEFYYSEDYHFVLLDDVDGVSLERLDYNRLSNDPTNWHSAAENVGWGTPGYENSQLSTALIPNDSFLINPEVFSPDNDGFDDVANISYTLDSPGHVANVTIYDKRGREVRRLVRNELLGIQGTFTWDGETDRLGKSPIGVYIVHIELFSISGDITSIKKTVVVGGRLSN